MDPDAPAWFEDDDTPTNTSAPTQVASAVSDTPASRPAPQIPTGPPVPNPYAHLVSMPTLFHNLRLIFQIELNKYRKISASSLKKKC